MRRRRSALQDLETAAARQHQIEDNEVERLGIRTKKSVFTGHRDDDLVVLLLQRRGHHVRQLSFVFDHQYAHKSNVRRLSILSNNQTARKTNSTGE